MSNERFVPVESVSSISSFRASLNTKLDAGDWTTVALLRTARAKDSRTRSNCISRRHVVSATLVGIFLVTGAAVTRLGEESFRSTPQRAHTIKKYVIPFVLISGALIATDRQQDVSYQKLRIRQSGVAECRNSERRTVWQACP